MIIRGMNLSLIIACIIIILALVIFPLIVSHKAEKQDSLKSEDKVNLSEWEKIKKYGEKINKKNREK
jgi:lipopolysaccharide export LptBFGC system permease protein LptF